ncbi:MAG: outer membrane protein assembly factor BamC [Gammaproteobacteria bacterium]|jgi:outer membrane protein assembly factor BamC
MSFVRILTLLFAASLLLAGCASDTNPDGSLKYSQTQPLPPLDVPPDLTKPELSGQYEIPEAQQGTVSALALEKQQQQAQPAPGTAAGGAAPAAAHGVLPQYAGLQVRRDGDMYWLESQSTPDQLWPRLLAFWRKQGLEIKKADPKTGLMVTDWAESKAGVPTGIMKYFGNLYDAGERDKYRLRLERTTSGGTDIFLTHEGAHQVVLDQDVTKWQLTPPNPERQAEMLTRLMVFLGSSEDEAKQAVASAQDQGALKTNLTSGDRPTLMVAADYPRVWRRLGIALDRAGLPVQDSDQDKGVYYVSYQSEPGDKPGFFARLLGGDKSKQGVDLDTGAPLKVYAEAQGDQVAIRIVDAKDHPLPAGASSILLKRIQTALK